VPSILSLLLPLPSLSPPLFTSMLQHKETKMIN
jgi:hypothetical protein